MKKRIFITVLIATIFTLLITTGTALAASTAHASIDPETTIRANLDAMSEAWKERDAEKYLTFLAEDAKIMTGGRDRIWVKKQKYGKKYLPSGMNSYPFNVMSVKFTKVEAKLITAKVSMDCGPRAGIISFIQKWVNNEGVWQLLKSSY